MSTQQIPGTGAFTGMTWDGHQWVGTPGQPTADIPKDRTPLKMGVCALVSPLALAVGLVVYFVVGLIAGLAAPDLPVEAMTMWLLVSVGGTVLGAWALVWRLMR